MGDFFSTFFAGFFDDFFADNGETPVTPTNPAGRERRVLTARRLRVR